MKVKAIRKEMKAMKIVVVRSPKALRYILSKIFGISTEGQHNKGK